jgi:hypothetical protein
MANATLAEPGRGVTVLRRPAPARGVRVRALADADLPAVVRLNGQVFGSGLAAETQASRFRELCLDNPWHDRASSLVAHDPDGRLIGFLGVVPRQMRLHGAPVTMAVSQHLMVAPDSRAPLAAIELLRVFLAGPQDLSVADWANDASRRLWERAGGWISLPYSLHWRRPLRPAAFGASLVASRVGPPALIRSLLLAARAADAALRPIRRAIVPPPKAGLTEPLTLAAHLALVEQAGRSRALSPVYDPGSLTWVLERLQQQTGLGRLQQVLVRDVRGQMAGWIVYFLQPGGVSRVFQIGATDSTIELVLDHLFQHAFLGGAVEVSGRMEPRFMRGFSSRRCLFTPGLAWMLVHSRRPEVAQTLDRGDAFLSRLEGDLWLL